MADEVGPETPPMMPRMLTIDGPSGIGKTTVLSDVANLIQEHGCPNSIISNNDSAPFSSAIRTLAKDSASPYSLALATAGARAFFHEAALTEFSICDRHVLSTLVYQSYAGVPDDFLLSINVPFLSGVIFVLLELSSDELKERRKSRHVAASDWFKRSLSPEVEIDLFRRAAETLRDAGFDVVVVAATGTANEVAERIVQRIWPQVEARMVHHGS